MPTVTEFIEQYITPYIKQKEGNAGQLNRLVEAHAIKLWLSQLPPNKELGDFDESEMRQVAIIAEFADRSTSPVKSRLVSKFKRDPRLYKWSIELRQAIGLKAASIDSDVDDEGIDVLAKDEDSLSSLDPDEGSSENDSLISFSPEFEAVSSGQSSRRIFQDKNDFLEDITCFFSQSALRPALSSHETQQVLATLRESINLVKGEERQQANNGVNAIDAIDSALEALTDSSIITRPQFSHSESVESGVGMDEGRDASVVDTTAVEVSVPGWLAKKLTTVFQKTLRQGEDAVEAGQYEAYKDWARGSGGRALQLKISNEAHRFPLLSIGRDGDRKQLKDGLSRLRNEVEARDLKQSLAFLLNYGGAGCLYGLAEYALRQNFTEVTSAGDFSLRSQSVNSQVPVSSFQLREDGQILYHEAFSMDCCELELDKNYPIKLTVDYLINPQSHSIECIGFSEEGLDAFETRVGIYKAFYQQKKLIEKNSNDFSENLKKYQQAVNELLENIQDQVDGNGARQILTELVSTVEAIQEQLQKQVRVDSATVDTIGVQESVLKGLTEQFERLPSFSAFEKLKLLKANENEFLRKLEAYKEEVARVRSEIRGDETVWPELAHGFEALKRVLGTFIDKVGFLQETLIGNVDPVSLDSKDLFEKNAILDSLKKQFKQLPNISDIEKQKEKAQELNRQCKSKLEELDRNYDVRAVELKKKKADTVQTLLRSPLSIFSLKTLPKASLQLKSASGGINQFAALQQTMDLFSQDAAALLGKDRSLTDLISRLVKENLGTVLGSLGRGKSSGEVFDNLCQVMRGDTGAQQFASSLLAKTSEVKLKKLAIVTMLGLLASQLKELAIDSKQKLCLLDPGQTEEQVGKGVVPCLSKMIDMLDYLQAQEMNELPSGNFIKRLFGGRSKFQSQTSDATVNLRETVSGVKLRVSKAQCTIDSLGEQLTRTESDCHQRKQQALSLCAQGIKEIAIALKGEGLSVNRPYYSLSSCQATLHCQPKSIEQVESEHEARLSVSMRAS